LKYIDGRNVLILHIKLENKFRNFPKNCLCSKEKFPHNNSESATSEFHTSAMLVLLILLTHSKV